MPPRYIPAESRERLERGAAIATAKAVHAIASALNLSNGRVTARVGDMMEIAGMLGLDVVETVEPVTRTGSYPRPKVMESGDYDGGTAPDLRKMMGEMKK